MPDTLGETMGEQVSRADLKLVEQTVEQERTERRHELRRASDRIDQLELRQNRAERILVGENGVNGVAGDVKTLKNADRNRERLAWILLTAAVGIIAYLLRGA